MRNTLIVVTVLPDLSKIDCEPAMDFLNDYISPHIHVAKLLFIIRSFLTELLAFDENDDKKNMFFFISNATMMSGNIRPVDWCYCQDLLG